MKAPAAVAGWLDDWVNPIVVKELRQAVRSRFIISIMNLFLLGQLLVLALSVATARGIGEAGSRVGRGTFIALMAVLHAACLVAVPLYAGLRLASERSDANVDLLFISTLRPRAIVRGKLFSAMTLTALIYSVCAPFLTFTYLLRGVDIPSILILLGLGLLVALACAQFALFLAALPLNKGLRAFVAILGLWALIGVLIPMVAAAEDMLRSGVGSKITRPDFLAAAGSFVVCALFGVAFLFELSVAMVTPPPANRAVGVRLLVTAGWLVTGGIATWWALKSRSHYALTGWMSSMTGVLCLIMLGCVSERDTLGARVRRQIPRNRPARLAAFLFYSGSAGGMAWVCLLLLLTVTATALSPSWAGLPAHSYGAGPWNSAITAASFCLYNVAMCLTALLLWRAFLHRWSPRHTVGALALILYTAVVLLPVLILTLTKQRDFYRIDRAFILGLPSAGRGDQFAMLHLAVSGAWAAVAGLTQLPLFLRQWKAFQPLNSAPESRPPTANPIPCPGETEPA